MSALCTISSKIDWIKMCAILFTVSFASYIRYTYQRTKKPFTRLSLGHFCWINLHLYSGEKVFILLKKFIHKTSTLICLISCNRSPNVVWICFIQIAAAIFCSHFFFISCVCIFELFHFIKMNYISNERNTHQHTNANKICTYIVVNITAMHVYIKNKISYFHSVQSLNLNWHKVSTVY